jgi:hypothetical protein
MSCGEGVKALKTDRVTRFNITTLAAEEVQVTTAAEDCCKYFTAASSSPGVWNLRPSRPPGCGS